jgi:hypothetical protein
MSRYSIESEHTRAHHRRQTETDCALSSALLRRVKVPLALG